MLLELNRTYLDINKRTNNEILQYLLCYPKYDNNLFKLRLHELKQLGIQRLELAGPTLLNGNAILGKGTRGIVIKAHSKNFYCALKIRRLDSPRINLLNEVKIQSYVNSFGVGPKIINYSDNFIMMELINGKVLSDFYLMSSINTEIIRCMIKSLLNQCYKLDLYGVDHGELSDLRKHVIINQRVNIIDFDSSSTNRKTSNLTSSVQYLFIGGPHSKTLQTLFDIDIDDVILLLRQYKLNKNHINFSHLLNLLNMN